MRVAVIGLGTMGMGAALNLVKAGHEVHGCDLRESARAELLAAGAEWARDNGVRVVWANARDAALDFYVRHGFDVVGEGFVEAVTSLPHHRVIRQLT